MIRMGILEPSGTIQNIAKLSSVINNRLGNKSKLWFSVYCYLRIKKLYFSDDHCLHHIMKVEK